MARREIDAFWDRKTRNDLNENFKELYNEYREAGLNAKEAREKAHEAVMKSDEAMALSERTQKELSQAILEGDSSPLGGQLSVGADGTIYSNPQERLVTEFNSVNQNLAQIENVVINAEKFGAKAESGFDNVYAIQAAIDFVASLGGGEVKLPPGLWRLSAKLILKHNVSLIGSGVKATTIQIFDGTNDHVIEFEPKPWKTGGTYQRLENLTIDGNKTGQTGLSHGIYAPSSVMYTYINNVEVRNCLSDGIRYVSSHRNILDNVVSEYNNGNGITLIDEVGEGVGTVTDNHVEMGYVTCSNNSGNGFNFIKPVDLKCVHLLATNNTLDGFYIKNPAGGWCNILDTIVSQGNRNALKIEGGTALTINNFSASVPSEYCLNVSELRGGQFNNMSLANGGLGNIYLNRLELSNMSNIISKNDKQDVDNIDMTNSRYNRFNNVYVEGGLHGIHQRNDSSANNFNNIEVREVAGYGIWIDGVSTVLIKENSYNGIYMRRIGSPDNAYTSAFYVRYAQDTHITGFRNSEDRATLDIDYAIDLSTSERCTISNSLGVGKINGFRKHQDNTTSIISDTAISQVF